MSQDPLCVLAGEAAWLLKPEDEVNKWLYTLHVTRDDAHAALCMRAANALPAFRLEAVFRNQEGNAVLAVEQRVSTSLKDLGRRKGVMAGTLKKACEAADALWKRSMCMPEFEIRVMANGEPLLWGLHSLEPISGPNDRRTVIRLGRLMMECITEEWGCEAREFVFGCTQEDPPFAICMPLCLHPFVASTLSVVEASRYPKYSSSRKPVYEHTPNKRFGLLVNSFKEEGPVKTRESFPHHRLLERILDHFETCSQQTAMVPLHVNFHGCKDTISDALLCEAWRYFLQRHAIWSHSPFGVFLSKRPGPCAACMEPACVFAKRYKAIGRWLGNTLMTGGIVPISLDPMFLEAALRPYGIFELGTPEYAEQFVFMHMADRTEELRKIGDGMREVAPCMQSVVPADLVEWLAGAKHTNRTAFLAKLQVHYFGSVAPKCVTWFLNWVRMCTEDSLRKFLTEATGNPAYEDEVLVIFNNADGTCAIACDYTIRLPIVQEIELFYAILGFEGPFLPLT